MKKNLSDYIQQLGNFLVAKEDCTLILSLDDYTINDNLLIDEENKTIWVKSLISKIRFSDIEFDIILDYAVNLFIEEMQVIKKQEIILEFSRENNILELTVEAEDIKKQTLYVGRLLGGRELFKDVNHLLMKLFSVFGGSVSNMDLVHMETLLSNILRDKSNLSVPARLAKKYDPTLINIKEIVFQKDTFLSSLNFENINKAIATSLISSGEKKDLSILEKVLLNDIVEDK